MGLTIGTVPTVSTSFTLPTPLDGYTTVASWMDSYVNSASPDSTVYSFELDIAVPDFLSGDTLANLLSAAKNALSLASLRLVAWQVDEGQATDVSIPDQICIPDGGPCFTPPGAGTTIATMATYRVWMLITPGASGMARGQFQFGAAAAVAVIVSVLAVLAFVAVVIGVSNGTAKMTDFTDFLKGMSPGGQATEPIIAASIPLAILGVMVGGAIVLMSRAPHGSGSIGVRAGPVTGTLEGRR